MSQGVAKRGFTTLQLLQLAAVARSNQLHNQTGLDYTKSSQAAADLANPQGGLGLPMPTNDKGEINVGGPSGLIKKLTKAGWFHDGRGDNAFRAVPGTPGEAIEARRAQILQYVNAAAPAFILNQAAYPQTVNPQTRLAGPNAGAVLQKAVTSSYSFPKVEVVNAAGKKTKKDINGITFQDRANAVRAVLAMTTAAEPDAPPTSGGGGRAQPFSVVQANAKIAATSGFQTAKLAKYVSGRVGKSTPAYAGEAKALLTAAQRVFGGATPTETKANIKALSQNRAGLLRGLQAMAQALGGEAKLANALWRLGTASSIKDTFSGSDILKPNKTTGWPFDPAQGPVQQPTTEGEATRYVFDGLLTRFMSDVSGQDVLTDKGQKRLESGGAARGAQGLLGVDDVLIANGITLAEPKKVALLVGKIRKLAYSMEAMQLAAKALNIAVPPDAVSTKAVALMIADGVFRAYRAQADAGSGDHVSAVAAARGINGYGDLRNADQIQEALAAVRRDVDAEYGVITSECGQNGPDGKFKSNYSMAALKAIGKAHNLPISNWSNATDACAALAAAGVTIEPPKPLSSGRRQATVPRVVKTSGGKSSGRRQVAAGQVGAVDLLAGLAGAASRAQTVRPVSPRLSQAATQPVATSQSRSPSGRRLSQSPSGRRLSQPLAPTSPRAGAVRLSQTNPLLADMGANDDLGSLFQ